MRRSRSGMASTMIRSSSRVAGSTPCLRRVTPAPRMLTGLTSISSSSTAEFMIVLSTA